MSFTGSPFRLVFCGGCLRYQLALVGRTDLDATFQQLLTPTFTMHLLDDLRATGHFSQAETSRMQQAILTAVTKDGDWIPCKE
jgi:hypothetical protein